jgi:hypothetical protein
MQKFWKYVWKKYPLIVGAFAKFVNVDRYPGVLYFGTDLTHCGIDVPADEEMSVMLMTLFFYEYFDIVVYSVPQEIQKGDEMLLVTAMGVYFPHELKKIAEGIEEVPHVFQFRKAPRLMFFITMMELATRFLFVILKENDVLPPTKKLSDYILAVIPEEKKEDEPDVIH